MIPSTAADHAGGRRGRRGMPRLSALRSNLIAGVVLALCLCTIPAFAGTVYAIPGTAQSGSGYPYFSSSSGYTSSFLGVDDLAATRSSTGSTNVRLFDPAEITFSADDPVNESWLAGTHSFYNLDNDSSREGNGSAVWFEFEFSNPLPANSYIIFGDFDVREQVSVQAYDTSGALVPYAQMLFRQHNGNDQEGATRTYIEWQDFDAGYSGKVAGTVRESGRNDPVVTLQSALALGRVRLEFDMDPFGDNVSNGAFFNFATESSVPEPGTYALMAAGLAGMLILRRKRRA